MYNTKTPLLVVLESWTKSTSVMTSLTKSTDKTLIYSTYHLKILTSNTTIDFQTWISGENMSKCLVFNTLRAGIRYIRTWISAWKQHFLLPYSPPSSSADCARELFKGSNGSASLVNCTRKKYFLVAGCGFFVTDVISEVVLGSFCSCCLA